jgi:L-asparaginase/Glu-tRNA(Gln) amidotransferase subunit D
MADWSASRKNRRGRHPTPEEWVATTCAAQGLPPKLSDAVVLANIECLICSALGYGHWLRESEVAPHDPDASRVAVLASPDGTDDDVVDQLGEDGPLALQGQQLPLLDELGPFREQPV